MKEVTDPNILAQLNGTSEKEVSDPSVLAQLNGVPMKSGFLDRISNDYNNRLFDSQSRAERFVSGQQGAIETAAQNALNLGIGIGSDVLGEGLGSLKSMADTASSQPIAKFSPVLQGYEGIKNVLGRVVDSQVGDFTRKIGQAYGEFSKENPRAADNINAAGNLLGVATSFAPTPKGGLSAVGATGKAVEAVSSPIISTVGNSYDAIKSGKAVDSLINVGIKGAQKTGGVIEKYADNISQKIARNGLPEEVQSLPNAELLYLKQFSDADVPLSKVASQLRPYAAQGLTPNAGIVTGVETIRGLSDLTARGTAGSKIAKTALNDVREVQIPKLNRQIIETATDAPIKSAQEYGMAASKAAKNLVDSKLSTLSARAAPYYEKAYNGKPVIDQTVSRIVEQPEMKAGISRGLKIQRIEAAAKGEKFDQQQYGITDFDAAGDPIISGVPNMRLLDAGKRGLDAMIEESKNQFGKTNELGRALLQLKGSLLNRLDAINPDYKTARALYSEDAGTVKNLRDSPIGQMSDLADGNFSKVADKLMASDSQYINKFINSIEKSGIDDPRKMKDSLIGAYLKNSLERTGDETLSFRQKILGGANSKAGNNLKALAGDARYQKILKVADTLDEMTSTAKILNNSQTAGLQTLKSAQQGLEVPPTGISSAINRIVSKVSPNLFDLVVKDPAQSRRLAELLFTDEGLKLVDKMNPAKKITLKDVENVSEILRKTEGQGITEPLKITVNPRRK